MAAAVQPEFSREFDVEALGETEKTIRLEAGAAECMALARRFDVQSIDRLAAELFLQRIQGSELICVHGRFSAVVAQSCIVTDVPVEAHIEETVDERFGPPGEAVQEIEFFVDEEDPPEPIVDGSIDLGEIVAQHLGVAIDPYPRAPNAEIPLQYGEQDGEAPKSVKNPFRALAALKHDEE